MIGLLILQIFFVSGPPPTQAEALRVLREMPSVTNVARWPEPPAGNGPRVTFTGATGPTLGPWAWPAPLPATRLDGTPLWLPPAVYGQPAWRPGWSHLSSGEPKSVTSGR